LDCSACTGYGTGVTANATYPYPCSDGCGTYTMCHTPYGCSDYVIIPCPGCPPSPPPPATQYFYCAAYGYSIPIGQFCPSSPPPPAASPPPPPPPPPPPAPPASNCFFCPAELGCFCIGSSCFC
jgi:hypothetical protein